MLNLEELVEPIKVSVPILNNSFQYHKKLYTIESPNGWHEVLLQGNKATIIGPSLNCFRSVHGYTFGEKLIYKNFDYAKRLGLPKQFPTLYFSNIESFSSVLAVYWEDKRFYFQSLDYGDLTIIPVQEAYLQEETNIEHIKGVSPELKMCFLLHSIELEKQKALLALKEKEEEERKFYSSILGRLKLTFERAGARLLKYQTTYDRIIADWKIPGSEYQYNSVIDLRTWKIIEAGFCMSNDDRRHNITSLVKLAEDYEDRSVIHITRR